MYAANALTLAQGGMRGTKNHVISCTRPRPVVGSPTSPILPEQHISNFSRIHGVKKSKDTNRATKNRTTAIAVLVHLSRWVI
jgi:hypothetical protein